MKPVVTDLLSLRLDLSDPHDGMHLQHQQQQQHPIPLHRVAGRGPAAGPAGFPVVRGRGANVGRTAAMQVISGFVVVDSPGKHNILFSMKTKSFTYGLVME
jgi:hypothetical protein